MMVKVLLYGYCVGVASSRRIAQWLHEDIAFRVLVANNTPDFRTISDFRKDCQGRIRRVDRLRRASKLPARKIWDTFEHDRTSANLRQQLKRLAEGDFVDHGVNVLAFGMPGTGKTHAMCAIGHRLLESGRSVLFSPAYRLVQDMLAAKRDLELPRMLRKLDNFDLLVVDDLGYLPQGAEGSEVLFTLIAERYECRSLGITSDLVFSEWEKVFANQMATAAAIERKPRCHASSSMTGTASRSAVPVALLTTKSSSRPLRFSISACPMNTNLASFAAACCLSEVWLVA